MFGYILPNLESLDESERGRYRAVYCGVCRSIQQRYGQLPRLTVSYDLTFMALVLGSLYEPEEKTGAKRCPMHPTQPQSFAQSIYTDYAADLSVAFAYHKLLDDWSDERAVRSRVAAAALSGAYRKAKQRIPELCAAIEQVMAEIQEIEQQAMRQERAELQNSQQGQQESVDSQEELQPEPQLKSRFQPEPQPALQPQSLPYISPDAPANRFGLLLGDLFACQNDFWSTDLRRFGARLGKFVYVMDAAMDLEEDLRTGSYNPFRNMNHDTQTLRDNLEFLAAGITDVFERLPLERDVHVMRSVLYAGVWQRFEAKEKKSHHG